DRFNSHIFRMDADGKNLKQLTFADLRQWNPRLSPDGKWVYYVQVPGNGRPQLVQKVSIDGGDPITLASISAGTGIHDVSKKDGRIIIEYTDPAEVKPPRHIAILLPQSDLAEAAMGLPKSAVKFDLPWTALSFTAVRFTPDGRIAFRDFKGDQPDTISVLPGNGKGKPTVLIPFPNDHGGYRWSYDGKQMAFVKITRTSDAILITNAGN